MNAIPSPCPGAFVSACLPAAAGPATLRVNLDNVLTVNLCETSWNNRGRLICTLSTLDRTALGRALLDELRTLAGAGAVTTLIWQPREGAPPVGAWHFLPAGGGGEAVLSTDTNLRRHAARIFPGLVNARNQLAQAQRWTAEPLDAQATTSTLRKQLAMLREIDAPIVHDERLTAYVAKDMRGSPLIANALQVAAAQPEGQALLRELSVLRDLGAIPLIDYNWEDPLGVAPAPEPDGTPVWGLHESRDAAALIRQLKALRDALAQAAPALATAPVAPDEVARRMHLARLRGHAAIPAPIWLGGDSTVRRDELDGLLAVDIIGPADSIRPDIVKDLTEMVRHDSGWDLLEYLRQDADKGHVLAICPGPASGAEVIAGRPVWIYNATDLEQRGDDPELPAATARTCAAYWDLTKLRNAAVMRAHGDRVVPLAPDQATRQYREEVLEHERHLRRRATHRHPPYIDRSQR
jgi:hypothetical protein